MDNLILIRAGIFLIAAILTFSFKKQLNDFRNKLLKKVHLKNKVKDQKKDYIYLSTVFIIISIALFIYAITH